MQRTFIFIITWILVALIVMVVIYCGYRLVLKSISDYKKMTKERKKNEE